MAVPSIRSVAFNSDAAVDYPSCVDIFGRDFRSYVLPPLFSVLYSRKKLIQSMKMLNEVFRTIILYWSCDFCNLQSAECISGCRGEVWLTVCNMISLKDETETKGAVPLRNFPSLWRIKNWPNKQQIIFTHQPHLTKTSRWRSCRKNSSRLL